MAIRAIVLQLCFLGLVAAIGGCMPKPPDFPELVAVKGVVKKGKDAVAGGQVQFSPDAVMAFTIASPVGADGSFALTTTRGTFDTSEHKAGAPAGKYLVTYLPPEGSTTGLVVFPKQITVKAGEDVVLDLAKGDAMKKADPKKGGAEPIKKVGIGDAPKKADAPKK